MSHKSYDENVKCDLDEFYEALKIHKETLSIDSLINLQSFWDNLPEALRCGELKELGEKYDLDCI